jgi:hypothetical protein
MPEPIPVSDLLSELNTQWNASNVAEPSYIEVMGANDPARYNLNTADYIVGRPGSPAFAETPIGNWKYVRREYNVELELLTRQSRQRLYDLMAEIRRICHNRRHDFVKFQRVQFQSFSEEVGEQANVWIGTVGIQFVNENVLAET